MSHATPDPFEPPPRERVFNVPGVVLAAAGAVLAVFALQSLIGQERELGLISALGFVPARFALALGLTSEEALLRSLLAAAGPQRSRDALAVAAWLLDDGGPRWWSILTHGVLHASMLHVGMNALWLLVFGTPVARRLGAGGFAILMAAGVAAGALAHLAANIGDAAPLIGASGGVSALTGAAARFVFSGRMGFGGMANDAAIRSLPALSLAGLARNRQALGFVIIWFVANWLFGSGALPLAGADQSIAWVASFAACRCVDAKHRSLARYPTFVAD
jgi:membrane associated rhomboid family serine protease